MTKRDDKTKIDRCVRMAWHAVLHLWTAIIFHWDYFLDSTTLVFWWLLVHHGGSRREQKCVVMPIQKFKIRNMHALCTSNRSFWLIIVWSFNCWSTGILVTKALKTVHSVPWKIVNQLILLSPLIGPSGPSSGQFSPSTKQLGHWINTTCRQLHL